MRKKILCLVAIFSFCSLSSYANEPFIYPQQGQDAQQIQKDKFECYGWATEQSGFDPMQRPTASSAPPQQTQGPSTGRSVVRGAAIGGLGGSIGGEFGKGAAAGAAVGLLGGGIRNKSHQTSQQQQQKEWAQQQAAEYNRNRDNYNRAFGACMEGRGYTVR